MRFDIPVYRLYIFLLVLSAWESDYLLAVFHPWNLVDRTVRAQSDTATMLQKGTG